MDTQRTILFSQSDLTDTINTIKYINELKKDFKFVFVSFTNADISDKIASKFNINLLHIPPVNSIQKIEDPEEIYKKLSRIEQEIHMPLEKLLFADIELYEIYKKNELSTLAWLLNVWEQYRRIIEENDVSLHFCFGEDRLPNLIPYYLINNRGGKSYLVRIVPYYGVTLTTDFFGNFTQDKNIKLGHVDFETYRSNIKEKKVYFSSDVINKVNYRQYLNILRLIDRLLEIQKINWQDRNNIYKNHNLRLINSFLIKPINKKIKGCISKSLIYNKIDNSERYIYYPFHFTDDAQVRLKYPEGYNQYELIRNISRNLPVGTRLLVKEHPAYVGNFSLQELLDLSRQPNITIADANVSSKDLLKNCDFVITINSTVGYEALFFNKVVITLGRSFYDDFPGVIQLNNLTDLYKTLKDTNLIRAKREELADKLKDKTIELLESALQFDYYNFYDDDNIRKLRDLLLVHIKSDVDDS